MTISAEALNRAVEANDLAEVRRLLEAGADLDLAQPLGYAIAHKRAEIVLALIEGGAEINAPIEVNVTRGLPIEAQSTTITDYLTWALYKKLRGVALALVEHGADVHAPDALALAAQRGYTKVVAAMLERGANDRAAAMYEAARKGRSGALHRLVDALGVDLELRVWDKSSLLDIAAKRGWTWLAESWVAAGGPLDTPGDYGRTPLHEALAHRNFSVAQVLCAHGADMLIALERSGYTPLHLAAGVGAQEVVKMWCAAGGDLNVATDKGKTPLTESLPEHPNVARLLIAYGADVHARTKRNSVEGYTPLHLAAEGGLLDVAQVLLDHGADPKARNAQGDTPLTLAERRGNMEMAHFLRQHGARNTADSLQQLLTPLTHRSTPYYAYRYFAKQGNYLATAVRSLAAMPETERIAATPIFHSHLGRRLRWIAMGYDQAPGMFDRLIELGVPLDDADDHGFTALHYASDLGDRECVDELLQHGASPNVKNHYGYTPLHYAACHDDPALVSALLEAGAAPAATLTQGRLAGWTPLHFALSHEHAANVALLRPLSPPVGEVEPGSHGLRGVFSINPNMCKPAEKTTPIHRHEVYRCVQCNERALYIIGSIADGTGLHAESTQHFTCANCGAHLIKVWTAGLKIHSGSLPWHILE